MSFKRTSECKKYFKYIEANRTFKFDIIDTYLMCSYLGMLDKNIWKGTVYLWGVC